MKWVIVASVAVIIGLPACDVVSPIVIMQFSDWEGGPEAAWHHGLGLYMPWLLRKLDSEGELTRQRAIEAIEAITGGDFDYDCDTYGSERQTAIREVRNWWEANRFLLWRPKRRRAEALPA
jgi:hypothetical protein